MKPYWIEYENRHDPDRHVWARIESTNQTEYMACTSVDDRGQGLGCVTLTAAELAENWVKT